MKITKASTIKEIAALVSQALNDKGLSAVLSGGAVVSIYTDNKYESKDLDFVTAEQIRDLESVLLALGFQKVNGRHFSHSQTEYYVEFPSSPLALGDELVQSWDELKTKAGTIQILTPTQCVMDRLAGFYHWNDKQNLDQAVMVAKKCNINLSRVKQWSIKEGKLDKFNIFKRALKK